MTKKHVLVIEDDSYLLDFYNEMKEEFEGDDVSMVIVENVKEGVKAIGKQQPDLVLLDLLMPEDDGYVFLQHLNVTDKIKEIKVFVLTNLDTDEDRKRCKEMGAAGYAIKSNLSHKMFKGLLLTGADDTCKL